ncbi:MAG TPA: YraN family protein [Candidatus Sulfotelmatobacter sp.]|jgi:putative endonuclease|nr:YraN family protein [Candidatus Sulfotelmatobacter sp.]
MEPPPEIDPRHRLGLAGEAVAERHLTSVGLRVVARRFRTRWGEVDLVACEGDLVVFVEVKSRSTTSFATPGEAVTRAKQRRLARAAQAFLTRAGWSERACRFDVVEVVAENGRARVRHIRDAFRPDV